jgi:hypothetical protein
VIADFFQKDKSVAHLTHVSEMEKMIETVARISIVLKDVIQRVVPSSKLLNYLNKHILPVLDKLLIFSTLFLILIPTLMITYLYLP